MGAELPYHQLVAQKFVVVRDVVLKVLGTVRVVVVRVFPNDDVRPADDVLDEHDLLDVLIGMNARGIRSHVAPSPLRHAMARRLHSHVATVRRCPLTRCRVPRAARRMKPAQCRAARFPAADYTTRARTRNNAAARLPHAARRASQTRSGGRGLQDGRLRSFCSLTGPARRHPQAYTPARRAPAHFSTRKGPA